nr:hypothetical protein [Sporichthya sp.]
MRKVAAGRADAAVHVWAENLTVHQVYLSAVTILELELGVLLAERADQAQGQILRQWLDEGVLRAFDQRILPVDVTVVRRAAALHVPDPAPFPDALIAANGTAAQADRSDAQPAGLRTLRRASGRQPLVLTGESRSTPVGTAGNSIQNTLPRPAAECTA